MTSYTAHFQPEAWQDDYAVPVDPEGPQEWDCTAWAQQHEDYLARITAARDVDPADGVLDTDDVFASDPDAPQWVREWAGPGTIRVRREGSSREHR